MGCSGCNFGPFKPMGESLWFPTVHEEARLVSDWKHIDERFIEGRRRHVLEEYHKLAEPEPALAFCILSTLMQAYHACINVERMQKAKAGSGSAKLLDTWWPWGAGMFATSLGPHDACFVVAANENKGS